MEFSSALPAELVALVDPIERLEEAVDTAAVAPLAAADRAFVATLASIELATTASGEDLPPTGNVTPPAVAAAQLPAATPASRLVSIATVADPFGGLQGDASAEQLVNGLLRQTQDGRESAGKIVANTESTLVVAARAHSPAERAPAAIVPAATDATPAELDPVPKDAQSRVVVSVDNLVRSEGKLATEPSQRVAAVPIEPNQLAGDDADFGHGAARDESRSPLPPRQPAGTTLLQRPAEFKLTVDGAAMAPEAAAIEPKMMLRSLPTPITDTSVSLPAVHSPVVPSTPGADSIAALKSLLPAEMSATGPPLDLRQPEQFAALATRIQSLIDNQLGEARIRLSPPELGVLEIKLSLVDDETFVHLAAVQPAARELLEGGIPRLRELLSMGGLELGQATVSDGQQREPAAPEPSPLNTETTLDAESETTTTQPSGRIDLYA